MTLNTESVRAVATGFKAIFLKAMKGATDRWRSKVHFIESTNAREKITIPEGVGQLSEWNGPRQIDTPIRWVVDVDAKDWQKTLAVPVNAYKDDQLGVYQSQVEMMGVAAANHPYKLVTDTMIAGFTTTSFDNVTYYSASHPTEAGVQSNLQTGALSSTTYRSALAKLQSMTDYYGAPLSMSSMGAKVKLIVGPDNRATANSIVSVQTTSSGAGNPDYGTAEVEVNEHLIGSYANYWFVQYEGGPAFPFIYVEREKADFVSITNPDSEEVFKNKRILHGVQGRWAAAFGFYQLSVGSTGS